MMCSWGRLVFAMKYNRRATRPDGLYYRDARKGRKRRGEGGGGPGALVIVAIIAAVAAAAYFMLK